VAEQAGQATQVAGIGVEVAGGERYRYGETISSAFVASTINRVVSKRMVKMQQMRWTKRGAHLLLQVRTQTLNSDLRDTFPRWYPAMPHSEIPVPLAA
jgi:hypothetical protein